MKRSRHFLSCVGLILTIFAFGWAQKPELVVQTGHSSTISSVAFSPDGKTLASGSNDTTVKLWDAATGRELRTLVGHGRGGVTSVAFSPDGILASGGDDKVIKLWDVKTGRELRTLSGLSGTVLSLAFSADGKTLASASIWDSTIKLWEVATGRELIALTGHSRGVNAVAFSRDGRLLASGSGDWSIKLWEPGTGRVLRTLKGHTNPVTSVAFSPDGKMLVSGSDDKTVRLWDTATGQEMRSLSGHPDGIASVAFSADGKTLASGGGNILEGTNTIALWDAATGRELRTLTGQSGKVNSVVFSPDGKTLATGGGIIGSGVNTIILWDVASGREGKTLTGHPGWVESITVSPDAKTLAMVSSDKIKLWDVATGHGVRTFSGHSGRVNSVTFSADGKTLASSSSDKTITLWDVATGRELDRLIGHTGSVSSVVFSSDGRTLASGGDDQVVKLWDVFTHKEIMTIAGRDTEGDISFSPDGALLAAGSKNDTIKLWEVASGKELRTLSGMSHPIAFSPDGKTLAGGGNVLNGTNTIKLWEVATGRELHTLTGHSWWVNSVAFSRDGKTLATGSWDHTIKLWEVATGRELRTLAGHSDIISSLTFTDRGILVSGSADATMKLWRPDSDKPLATLISQDKDDWVVITSDGLFDGSPGAWKQLFWRFDNNTFKFAPVEAFFKEFYYPGLLPKIMAGTPPKPPLKNLSEVDIRQPQVRITGVNGKAGIEQATGQLANPVIGRNSRVALEITDNINEPSRRAHPKTSGAQDIRLFRNGSLVKFWPGDVFALGEKEGCRLQPQASRQSSRCAICTATVPIVAGRNNFTAYAFNSDNVKSEDASFVFNGADSLKRKGILRIFAVGVSLYANREYNLNYTTDDAISFALQLKIGQEKLGRYQSVEVKTLLNENATKENILAELKKLTASAQPEDAVVVYFSGHGKASGDHFYLVPNDLGYAGSRDQLSDAGLQQILTHSISDLELEEAFRDIDAGQMFMIIDACNSGQALENKDEPRRGPMNTRGLAQLAYEKGMYILTASQNVEEAFVSEKLKHSYLTHALVEEGLKTKAADADQNGEVNLREWFDYALDRVPKLREETLQSKSLEEVTPQLRTARSQKSQTPRVFYRREPETHPLIVARP